jgi:hypothetical protein
MKDCLPHGLQQIADAAGIEAALTIALARGGMRLRIPKRAEGSILVDLVGIDAAARIVEALADERIEIPLAARVLAEWLDAQGWSQEAIANRLRKSRRTIQYWLTGTTPTRQPDLFDRAS